MGDLFDEFKRELERRRAAAEGRGAVNEHGQPDDEDAPDTGADDADDLENADGDEGRRRR